MNPFACLLAACLGLSSLGAVAAPEVLLLDGEALAQARDRIVAGEAAYTEAVKTLCKEAEESLAAGPFSVMDKPFTPPSGDKHDYMSVGPYWWPDPKKKDGLPYIRKDGVVNPERNEYDNVGMGQVTRHTKTLANAFWFTGEERYARHAATLVRTWFLDPDTRMNPNLNYAQAIPGRTKGRGIGIIDTLHLPELIDATLLLAASESWTAADKAGLQQWFKDYTHWLTTHPNGLDEADEHNNHGAWYDVQVAAFSLYTGNPERAKRVLEESKTRRIAKHIDPEGRQPHELKRTKSYAYSAMNLRGLMSLATLGERAGVDLWGYESSDGRSIRKALDWMLAHAFGEGAWAYENLTPIEPGALLPLLVRAEKVWPEGGYAQWRTRLDPDWPSGSDRLLY